VPSDQPAALAALNFGKPLPEASPNSPIVKALKPLVASLDQPAESADAATSPTGMLLRFARALRGRRDGR
jgi:hypothetical protein